MTSGLLLWEIVERASPRLWRNPFVKSLNVPHLIDILMRTTELSSVALQHEHLRMADLYLAPPVKNFGILEFDAAEQIIKIGYKFARKKINEWQTGFFKF